MGYEVGDISYSTKNHYSFVYAIADKTVGVPRKGDIDKTVLIRALADHGLTPGQIATELNCNYNFVHSTVKDHKEALKASKEA
jgi:ABC-type nitrate/sulfonate/bicarbonate transport system substrate-binding protein